MAILRLSSCPAERSIGDCISFRPMSDVLPTESVEIRTAADAVRALESYAARVQATGQPAHVSGFLARGQRAPSGFRQLRLERVVNL